MDNQFKGKDTYYDTSNRPIYIDPISKKAYQLQKEDYKPFTLLSNRWIAIICVFCLMGTFLGNFLFALIIAACLAIILELYFRCIYIKKLTPITKYKLQEKKTHKQELIEKSSKRNIVFKTILSLAISILITVNAKVSGYTGANLYLCYVTSVAVFGYFIFLLTVIKETK